MVAGSESGQSELKPREATPGLAHARLDYSLHEEVVKANVLPEKLDAKQRVKEEYTRDILGLRGPQWDSSVGGVDAPKWSKDSASRALSNTLTPQHINPADLRTLKGTTHCRADPNAEFQRGVAVGWNGSTTADPAGMRRALEAQTTQALSSTRRVAAGLKDYTPPLAQQQAVIDRVREQKRSTGIDMGELEQKYGKEGAAAMRDILVMRRTKGIDNPDGTLAKRPAVKGRARPEDIEAVRNLTFGGTLDEDDADGYQIETPEPEEAEPVQAGPSGSQAPA